MALSRAQHEANKANCAYHIDRHGNRVAPALARSARSTDVVTGVRHTASNSAIVTPQNPFPRVSVSTARLLPKPNTSPEYISRLTSA